MARYARNMAVLAKIETTAGVDAAPAAATDGLLIAEKIDITPLDIKSADRNLLLPYFGGSAKLVAEVSSKISFSVELAGSGTAGTAAAWSSLMQGCACAQSVLATPARIEHVPLTNGLKTITIYLYDDGVLHKITGAMGNAKLSFKKNETPKISFEFLGAYVPVTAVAMPNVTLTAWKVPLPVVAANVVDVTIGCTYAAGVLTGGTTYGSQGIEIDLGNKPVIFSTLMRIGAEITDRQSTCSFSLELNAAQEVQAATDVRNNVLTGVGFTLGTTAGQKIMFHAPSMQRSGFKKGEQDGIRLIDFEAQLVPVSGNDEFRLIQL